MTQIDGSSPNPAYVRISDLAICLEHVIHVSPISRRSRSSARERRNDDFLILRMSNQIGGGAILRGHVTSVFEFSENVKAKLPSGLRM
jgi:hypothetical protein